MVTISDPGSSDPLAEKLIQFVELWDNYRHILNPVPVGPDQELGGTDTAAFGVPRRALEQEGQSSSREAVPGRAGKRHRKAA